MFCEAAAYGLPVLATRTGGVPTVVEEGRTGLLFPLDAEGQQYADAIQGLLADSARLTAMRRAARGRFEHVLNWEAFVQAMLDQAAPLLPSRKAL
ncbi:MAG: glycosyltransferase family 4 protein [Flavobacteriales bacterium]|nr:glycosyltransferase family 4 protein [Flavobacteriales bacterium]